MPPERFDSSVAKPASATNTHPRHQNAPTRRLERLASIRTWRLSSIWQGKIPPLLAPPPFKAGGKAKQRQRNLSSLFIGSVNSLIGEIAGVMLTSDEAKVVPFGS